MVGVLWVLWASFFCLAKCFIFIFEHSMKLWRYQFQSYSVGNILPVSLVGSFSLKLSWLPWSSGCSRNGGRLGPGRTWPCEQGSLGSRCSAVVLQSTWVHFMSDMRQSEKQNKLLSAFLSSCGMERGPFYCPHCWVCCIVGSWDSSLIAFEMLSVMLRTPWTFPSRH